MNAAYKLMYFPINLSMFDGNTNVTTDSGLSQDVKIYWSNRLIDMCEPKLVHSQFAQKVNIPSHSGKTVEFRKWSPLPKMLTPLTEGVTPNGQKLNMSTITAVVEQYGGYVETSDILNLVAIDNAMEQSVKQIARQAHRTIDTIDRDVMVAGTNKLLSGQKGARYLLTGGAASGNNYLCVDDIKRAARQLKVMNAEPVDDCYVAIIHPDISYDLTNDPEWKYPHQYVDTKEIYSGEIGKIGGVRFVETTEAKKYVADPLLIADGDATAVRELTVSSYTSASKTVVVKEAVTANQAAKLAGRRVLIGGALSTVSSATAGSAGAASLVLQNTPSVAPAANNTVYPGEAGAEGRDVYATIVLAANAYGVTQVSGGGLEFIAKQLGSGGTSDPLNQRATAGWKCTRVCKILVDEYMVRVESCSTFNDHDAN